MKLGELALVVMLWAIMTGLGTLAPFFPEKSWWKRFTYIQFALVIAGMIAMLVYWLVQLSIWELKVV